MLIVVGDGPLRPQVEEAARTQGGGTIRVLGYRTDVSRILGAADFFVLSSQREGFSFALLEAMSLGCRPWCRMPRATLRRSATAGSSPRTVTFKGSPMGLRDSRGTSGSGTASVSGPESG